MFADCEDWDSLHIGFRENDAFVFSFTNTGWDSPNGLQVLRMPPYFEAVQCISSACCLDLRTTAIFCGGADLFLSSDQFFLSQRPGCLGALGRFVLQGASNRFLFMGMTIRFFGLLAWCECYVCVLSVLHF